MRAGKRSVDAEGIAPGAKGTDWTAEQVAIVVANYFLMLERERAGEKINKAELYRRLAREVGRSEKSIEWKLRNVSAVLEELGIAWIPGLLSAHNYQDSLVESVEVQLGLHPKILTDPVSVKPRFTSAEGPVLVPPPAFLNSDPQDRQPALRRLLGKYDPAARDDFSRSLGRAGEEMVFKFEYDRLCQAGRSDLAKEMDWPVDRGEDHRATTSDPSSRTTARSGYSRSRPPTGTPAPGSGCPATKSRPPRRTRPPTASGGSSISGTGLRCSTSSRRSTAACGSSRTNTLPCRDRLS